MAEREALDTGKSPRQRRPGRGRPPRDRQGQQRPPRAPRDVGDGGEPRAAARRGQKLSLSLRATGATHNVKASRDGSELTRITPLGYFNLKPRKVRPLHCSFEEKVAREFFGCQLGANKSAGFTGREDRTTNGGRARGDLGRRRPGVGARHEKDEARIRRGCTRTPAGPAVRRGAG